MAAALVASPQTFSLPPGRIRCILCQGLVSYNMADVSRYHNHMNHEHGAFSNLEFLLTACLMSQEQKNEVIEKYQPGLRLDLPLPDLPPTPTSLPGDPPSLFKTPTPAKRKARDSSLENSTFKRTPQNTIEVKKEVVKKESPPRLTCDDCQASFTMQIALRNHQKRNHHGSFQVDQESRPPDPPPSLDNYNQLMESLTRRWLQQASASETKSVKIIDFPTNDHEWSDLISSNQSNEKESEGVNEDNDDDDEIIAETIIFREADLKKSSFFTKYTDTWERIEDNKDGLKEENFVPIRSEKMPQGWKKFERFKSLRAGAKKVEKIYLTKDLTILKTEIAVLEFMKMTNRYSSRDLLETAEYLRIPKKILEAWIKMD